MMTKQELLERQLACADQMELVAEQVEDPIRRNVMLALSGLVRAASIEMNKHGTIETTMAMADAAGLLLSAAPKEVRLPLVVRLLGAVTEGEKLLAEAVEDRKKAMGFVPNA